MSKVKHVEQVTHNRFLNFYNLEAENRKGGTFPYFMASRAESVEDLVMNRPDKRADGVAIYALKDDKVVLIRQYRYPVGGYVYEFPAGLVEEGEDFHISAVREMKEETGLDLKLEQVDPMFERACYTTDGMTDERCSMVFGRVTGEVSSKGLEDTEELEVVLADREEVRRILKEEQVAQMCGLMLMHFLHDTQDPFGFLR